MMGNKQRVKSSAEWDLLTGWRHVMCYMQRAGVKKSIKNQMARRRRYATKKIVKEVICQLE